MSAACLTNGAPIIAAFVVCLLVAPPLRAEELPVPEQQAEAELSAENDQAVPSEDPGKIAADGPDNEPPDPCDQYDPNQESWLDRNQIRVYRTVCGTAAWIDGFFGDSRYDRATGGTYGRIGVGTFWDERNAWDNDFRLRARYALPSLRKRGAILVGRGDEQLLLEERTTSERANQPAKTSSNDDDALYVGFGFRGFDEGERGLDYSVGVKVRSSPELFAKTSYESAWQLSQASRVTARPIVYWRSDEGFGSTLNLEFDYLLSETLLYRWGNFANISEDEEVEGVAWGSTMSLFQVLSKRRALTYSIFASGETKADVELQNYGLEFRYRQRILRKWLFIEYLGRISWPREFFIEKRETNFGAGISLEVYFGPAPESWVR